MNKKYLPLAFLAFASMASAQTLWFDVAGSVPGGTNRVCSPAVDCTVDTPTPGVDDGGYWFDYDDRENDGGSSSVTYPVAANEYGDYVAPMIDATGSISITMNAGAAAEYPFVGYGFNIVNGNKDATNVANFGSGVCVVLQNSAKLSMEMEYTGNGSLTEYNEPAFAITPKTAQSIVDIPWASFKQESGWGTPISGDPTAQTVAFKLKFAGTNGSTATNNVKIWQFGALGTCTIGTIAIENSVTVSNNVKAHLAGRTLSFSGVNAGANVEVINLQGQVMVKSVLNSSVNLSNLDAGVYMVRVSGKAVNFNQKIVLK
ncbi:MAG: T9SS type A sorting domain-containing protein [Fibrobacter sp.]|jgi:hypothetical protein|nr:T9SS type A sorting domain-containing protein [Fibrobacter sp.]